MASQAKQPSEQKLLEVLQNCKQIPKDDRLTLRKIIKEGDEELTAILADFNNKKLQVRLRKFLLKAKENKKADADSNNRQKTNVDVRGLTKEPAQSFYRSALQSMEKEKRKTLDASKIKDFKQQLQEYRYSRSNSNSELLKPSHTLAQISNTLASPKQEQLGNVWNNGSNSKYTLENNYLKESQNAPFSSSCELLKWDCLKMATSMPTSNFSSMRNSFILGSGTGYGSPKEETEFTSIFSKLRSSLTGQKEENSAEKDLYNFKSALIKHYAEDIFEYVVSKHFPLSLNDKSVYLPYRQLLQEVQNYLQGKGEQVHVLREGESKVPLLEPFANEYEAVCIKNLGAFLSRFCLHKNNPIRSIFIVLESGEGSGISVDKFRKINSWKGEELIDLFDKLVRKWGEANCITYWQVLRAKNEKEFLAFHGLYSKL